jgi:hypothetical protein
VATLPEYLLHQTFEASKIEMCVACSVVFPTEPVAPFIVWAVLLLRGKQKAPDRMSSPALYIEVLREALTRWGSQPRMAAWIDSHSLAKVLRGVKATEIPHPLPKV